MKVAFYTRVSSQTQEKGRSFDEQFQHLKEYAQQKGWPIGEKNLFYDEGSCSFSSLITDRTHFF